MNPLRSENFSPELKNRWDSLIEPDWARNQEIFQGLHKRLGHRRNVLNCAVPLARAKELTDFRMPEGWNLDKCLQTSVGFGGPGGRLPEGLENWKYTAHIKPVPQLPQMKQLSPEHATLVRSPWFQTPSQSLGMGINARHLRYHYDLWQAMHPKTLRGVSTTLVLVTPQIGYALTPHIKLDNILKMFFILGRPACPVQLFPAGYLYPDAQLAGLDNVPAPMFADILPFLGATLPTMDVQPDPWGTLVRLGQRNRYYCYPFNMLDNPIEDTTIANFWRGETILPSGQKVMSRFSEAFAYATLDAELRRALLLDKEAFNANYGLDRGVVTHDGLPFRLPIEMQTAVFAIILTGWELEMDQPGDLSSYTLRTQHAAIRGYNFYQQQEPFYSNFMRLVNELSRDPKFCTYPLASHLTYNYLGGNLRLPNQRSEPERVLGPEFLRQYCQQQLDWSMGVFNLWNLAEFRRLPELENQLSFDGVAFHQMRNQLRPEAHLFQRPLKRASFWPETHPEWLTFDQQFQARDLPRSEER